MKIAKLLNIKPTFEDPRTVKVKDMDCVLVVTNCVAAFDYNHTTIEIGTFDGYRLVAINKSESGYQIGRYRSGGMAQDVTHVPEMQAMAEEVSAQ